ncbi:MAG: DHH family phosphoesterase [Candidatus Diapherotrites archaeon]|nr:DHH family phosphoesterase [Candidatus Diapherotrites archaeon]
MHSKVLGFLSGMLHKRVLVLTHSAADIDAISAAGALYFTFRKNSSISIGIPEHINTNAKQLARSLKIPYAMNPGNFGDYDCIILVDFNSRDMLGSLQGALQAFNKPVLLIDHHNLSSDKIASPELSIIRPECISTTEVIHDLLKLANLQMNAETAKCIASGIYADSAGFSVADHETFRIFADVLEKAKINFSQLLELFSAEEDFSEKIAKLKAAKRASIFKIAGYIAVATEVSCFEASAASSLIRVGADISFAASSDKKEMRISARASNEIVRKFNFDLTRDIFAKMANEFDAKFGGHPGAAALNAKNADSEKALKRCIELAHEFLKSHIRGAKMKDYSD